MPNVSVVIPTHNRPAWLAEALASVRAQTFTDYEIIVVSNGECAETRCKSRSISEAHGATYFALDKSSVSAARNFGVAKAAGDWIAFLDDDDIWFPEKLERQLAEAERSGADMVVCDYAAFAPDGGKCYVADGTVIRPRVPDGWSRTKAANRHCWWTIPWVTLLQKSLFDEVGVFDEGMAYIEDMDLWRRISWRHRIQDMNEVLLYYRVGHLNTMHPANARKRARWDLHHFRKMYRDTPADLRDALPSFREFAAPRLIEICCPDWLLKLKPRTRFNQLRYRLRLRTRFNELRYRLRLRTRFNQLRYRLRLRTRIRAGGAS
jgi:glycosyltransferase involved in cell wall biosynthesis